MSTNAAVLATAAAGVSTNAAGVSTTAADGSAAVTDAFAAGANVSTDATGVATAAAGVSTAAADVSAAVTDVSTAVSHVAPPVPDLTSATPCGFAAVSDSAAAAVVPIDRTTSCWRDGKIFLLSHKCLTGHLLKEFAAKTANQCAFLCLHEPGCRSFNLRQDPHLIGAQRMCQLLDISSSQAEEDEDLMQDQSCRHFSI